MVPRSFICSGLALALSGLLTGPLTAAVPGPPASDMKPAKPTLTWGDRAPALTVSRWVKGAPVKGFKKGEVYVVEFWATWCGPCKQAIPHLTELAKRYQGKVSFIGVDVWEKGAPAAVDRKVDTFVETMGPRMDYHVGQDRPDGSMVRAWMEAAGQEGIPAAFIVDGAGRIAWIGFPDSLEEPLKALLGGTYDLKAQVAKMNATSPEREAALAAEEAERTAAFKVLEEIKPGVEKAMAAKEWARALEQVEQAEASHPGLPTLKQLFNLGGIHVEILTHIDPARAEALLEASLNPPTARAYRIAVHFVLNQLSHGDPRWSRLGLGFLDRASALDPALTHELNPARFGLLLRTDPTKARALFDAERQAFDNSGLLEMIDHILALEGVGNPWLETVVSVLKPLQKDPQCGHTLAQVYHRLGRDKLAVPLQEQFLAYLRGEEAGPEILDEYEQELQTYRAAKS